MRIGCRPFWGYCLTLVGAFLVNPLYAAAPSVKIVESRTVEVAYNGRTTAVEIPAKTIQTVVDERYDNLPVFNPNTSPWGKGRVLRGVNACECAVFFALDPDSVVVKLASSKEVLKRGVDYEFENTTGALGILKGGKLEAENSALISYRCVESRIDSIIAESDGTIKLVQGQPIVLSPEPPIIDAGAKRLVNVYTTGWADDLTDAAIFPIDEVFADSSNSLDAVQFVEKVGEYSAKNGDSAILPVSDVGAVKKYLPKTWEKLTKGEEVRILAWGDSVTACGFLPDNQRWQVKFTEKLRTRFPNAKIVLMTEAWGGRNTDSYRNEPPGSEKNYKEKVLDLKPDLIISEFVNDMFMDEATVAKKYGEILNDFNGIGADWIILGPHYVRPDWMGLASERDCDNDPRQLVKGLRAFTLDKQIPYADTPTLYGKMWRAGIPYNTLMTNNINHPNNFGMEIFAAALMRLFEE